MSFPFLLSSGWCINPTRSGVSLSSHLTGEDISPVQDDGGVWDLFTTAGWAQSGDSASEVAYPKRLVQQIGSGEELEHDRLDTRAKNGSGGSGNTSVSLSIGRKIDPDGRAERERVFILDHTERFSS